MKTVKVVGKLFWAKHMTEPNTQFNPDNTKYEICIGGLDDLTVKRLTTELNIKVKERAGDEYGRGHYIVAKTSFKIKAVDSEGKEVDASAIGNGTVASCTLSSFLHRMSDKHGYGVSIVHSASIPALIIKELVSYTEPAPVEEDIVL